MSDRYDLVIMGGGLAGLTLGLQLADARPSTSILIAEKRSGPAPEAAFKVGESTVELSAFYFSEICKMKDHLEAEQLPKNGLRFFFSANGNEDISERPEWGPSVFPPTPAFQLDRGRFENALAESNAAREGTTLLDGCTVEDVEVRPDGDHVVRISRGGETSEVQARWVVDTTGRTQFLKRKFGLEKPVGHTINSSWLRLAGGLDLEDWSDDPDWHARVDGTHQRHLSTNHLMGTGYWVWLIPLSSGAISIGIVADPRYHPFDQINTLDGAIDWLIRHEPPLGRALDERRGHVEDFLVAEDFAYSCQRVYSPDRWALSGIAGCFLDPLYSPGSDQIAISNTFVTDIVTRELDGEDVTERVEALNALFLAIYDGGLVIYERMYEIFGDALVMSANLGFNYAFYWGQTVPRFMHGKLGDLAFLGRTREQLMRTGAIRRRFQDFLLDWHRRRDPTAPSGIVATSDFTSLYQLAIDLDDRLDDDALAEQLARNSQMLEAVAVAIFHRAASEVLGDRAPDASAKIEPTALTLDPDAFEDRGLINAETGMSLERALELAPGVEALWYGE